MYDASYIINIAFRWINFLIVLGIIVYFLKTKLLSVMKASIQDRKQFFISLRHQLKQAQESNTIINEHIDKQQHEMSILRKKVLQWDTAVKKDQEEQEEIYQERIEKMHKMRLLQLKNFSVSEVQKKLVPDVLHKTQEELNTMFKQKKNQNNFLDELLLFMKKK